MRVKIAFLTVLALHAIAVGGYWVLRFLGWQALYFIHLLGLNHECPQKHIESALVFCFMEIVFLVIAIGILYASKMMVVGTYIKIDHMFPKKES